MASSTMAVFRFSQTFKSLALSRAASSLNRDTSHRQGWHYLPVTVYLLVSVSGTVQL
jgi:hypothetical protein